MTRQLPATERILDAAAAVVLKDGGAHMTMDAVAAKAGVSKGGLIYHFPNMNAMMEAMLDRFIERTMAKITAFHAELPESPARSVKAHILAMLALGEDDMRTAQAILAATAREPALLVKARESRRKTMDSLMGGVASPQLISILMLATEGMWTSELLGICIRDTRQRETIKATLLRLADEWCGAKALPRGWTGKPRRRKAGAR